MSVERVDNQEGLLIVITGPSGCGKDVVANKLLEIRPEIKKIVTCTNRPPREGEVNGVDYHFLSSEQMEMEILEGKFLEYVVYREHENGQKEYKGTKSNFISEVVSEKRTYLWRIDPSRTATLDELYQQQIPDLYEEIKQRTLLVYIGAPNLMTLVKRRMTRDKDNVSKQQILQNIKKDWEIWKKYEQVFSKNNIIINQDGKLEETVKELHRIIKNKEKELKDKNKK